MNYENHILGNIDRKRENRTELSPNMERAYTKANRILNTPEYSIQEEDFRYIYGDEAVQRDIERVRKLEAIFVQNVSVQEKNSKKIADVLEAIVLTQSEMSNWMGDAKTLRSSRFDDYVNKVDMIAEWHTPGENSRVLGLAVDVTFGLSSVQKKMREIKAEIDSGTLGSIRYFKDEKGDFMGTRNNVPRTIIGISQPVVQELAFLWTEGENKILGAHPIQRLFIDQVTSQLRQMEKYALSKGKHDVAFAYQKALAAVSPVEQLKRGISAGELNNDLVAQEIQIQLAQNFRV